MPVRYNTKPSPISFNIGRDIQCKYLEKMGFSIKWKKGIPNMIISVVFKFSSPKNHMSMIFNIRVKILRIRMYGQSY